MGLNVVSMSCGVPHHELGWECGRIRGHFGEHLATDPWHDAAGTEPARRTSWVTCNDVHDETGLTCVLPPEHATDHAHEDAVGRSVSWPSPASQAFRRLDLEHEHIAGGIALDPPELLEAGDPGARYRHAFVATLLLLLWLCCPAIIVAAYRWGF